MVHLVNHHILNWKPHKLLHVPPNIFTYPQQVYCTTPKFISSVGLDILGSMALFTRTANKEIIRYHTSNRLQRQSNRPAKSRSFFKKSLPPAKRPSGLRSDPHIRTGPQPPPPTKKGVVPAPVVNAHGLDAPMGNFCEACVDCNL